ncbi:hypothetical protein Fmac_025867 [Flemingia macrophylla]|uniref:Glycine-rich protein n=1 Tax=Flemingia macrophylla TaxID=520843 RepID=A0ABD1LDH3_9FABA
MKISFIAFFLLISAIQAISTSHFNTNFTSEANGLIHSNGQTHKLLVTGKLYGSVEGSIRLNDKVEETIKGYKEEGPVISRKAQGGSSGGGGKRGGTSGSGGSEDVTRRPRQSSAPSEPHFSVSIFNLCVSLVLVVFFPFHQV